MYSNNHHTRKLAASPHSPTSGLCWTYRMCCSSSGLVAFVAQRQPHYCRRVSFLSLLQVRLRRNSHTRTHTHTHAHSACMHACTGSLLRHNAWSSCCSHNRYKPERITPIKLEKSHWLFILSHLLTPHLYSQCVCVPSHDDHGIIIVIIRLHLHYHMCVHQYVYCMYTMIEFVACCKIKPYIR